jgi:hypothetical protein
VWVARTTDPQRPWLGAATMTGTALLVATPGYPWYALLVVLMVGLGARTVWLAVVVAGYVASYAAVLHLGATAAARLGYGLALAAVVLVAGSGAIAGRRGGGTLEPAGPVEPTGPGGSSGSGEGSATS